MLSETTRVLSASRNHACRGNCPRKVSDPASTVIFMNRITELTTGFISGGLVNGSCQWRRLGSTV